MSDKLNQRLDRVQQMIVGGQTMDAMDDLFTYTNAQRSALREPDWFSMIEQARSHPVFGIVLEDPITHRCFRKPRGYPGDAGLLDLIYGWQETLGVVSETAGYGRSIYDYTYHSATAGSVRWRCRQLSDLIDEAANRCADPRILSLAAGHLREGNLSVALRSGGVRELVALDQDEESLAEIRRSCSSIPVNTVQMTIRPLLTGRHSLGSFDLVYAAGLFDYLDDRIASRLTAQLFEILNPGGRLCLFNFVPSIPAAGYMEMFMDWNLVYRDADAIRHLACEIQDMMTDCTTRFDPTHHIGMLSLYRP